MTELTHEKADILTQYETFKAQLNIKNDLVEQKQKQILSFQEQNFTLQN